MTGTPSLGVGALRALAEDFGDDGEVEFGTMFRSPGLRVCGRIFAFVGREDRLVVKLPRGRARELIASGAATEVKMGERTMREWVAIPPLGQGDHESELWGVLVHEAHDYVKSL